MHQKFDDKLQQNQELCLLIKENRDFMPWFIKNCVPEEVLPLDMFATEYSKSVLQEYINQLKQFPSKKELKQVIQLASISQRDALEAMRVARKANNIKAGGITEKLLQGKCDHWQGIIAFLRTVKISD